MTSILDHFPKNSEEFIPSSIPAFTVLQIVRKTGNMPDLERSMVATERHSLSTVIGAYKKAIRKPDPSAYFHKSIKQLTEQ